MDINAQRVQYREEDGGGNEDINVHDPSQAWYTGHYHSDVHKLSQQVHKQVQQYDHTRPDNRNRATEKQGRTLERQQHKHAVQGAKELLRMVQANKVHGT